MQYSTVTQRVGAVLTTWSLGAWPGGYTQCPQDEHTGAWGQRTKAGGPRRMLEETVPAEVRTGAMDHDAVASL